MNGLTAQTPALRWRPADPARPQLLVSVRSLAEAQAAIAGGADIIDVKEPSAGPLGMAAPAVIEAIAAHCVAAGVPCSAALGELTDRCVDAASWRLSAKLNWAKVGLAGCRGRSGWMNDLRSVCECRLAPVTQRIAVAYVDVDRACAPSISEVADFALAQDCAGLLLDTWDKSGGGLLAWVSPRELAQLCTRLRSAGLFVAAAGRLTPDELPGVIEAGASIVAVRSAVCVGGDRQAVVTAEGVARFRARW